MTKVRIEIPNPCHESWDEMTPQEKGRFCATCKKTVRDYTKLSDEQLTAILKNSQSHCGRFRKDQLEKEFTLEDRRLQWQRAAIWLFPLLLGGGQLAAQASPVIQEKLELQSNISKNNPLQKMGSGPIEAWVFDADHKEPLIGCSVLIKGTNRGTVTGIDGEFSLPREGLTESDVLVFSYTGYATQEISVKKLLKKREVLLKASAELLEEVVLVAGLFISKKVKPKEIEPDIVLEPKPQKANLPLQNLKTPLNKIEHIVVSPNPFQDHFTISFQLKAKEKIQLELLNSTGQLIQVKEYNAELGDNNFSWQISDTRLVAGLYYIRIISQESKELHTLSLIHQGR